MSLSESLEIASATDPGMVRSHNEDSIASDASRGLAVLADGMGGYNAGEVASGIATTVITTELQQLLETTQPYAVEEGSGKSIAEKLLRDQIAKANTSIYQSAQSQPQYAGMGTTLVMGLFYDNRVSSAWRDVRSGHQRSLPFAGADRWRPDHEGAGEAFGEQEFGYARAWDRPYG